MQSGREEERFAIKFSFKLGKNTTETYGMLQTAFRPSCMNRASVFKWHKRFKEGRESVRVGERCGRSKEINRPELLSFKRNHFEMRLLNLRINLFYCGLFVLILVGFFCVVSSSLRFGEISPLAFFRCLTATSDRNAESCNRIPSNYCLP